MRVSPTKRQLSILIATLLAAFSAGASMGYPSILLYQLKRDDSEIPLDLDKASWMGSIFGIAGIPAFVAPGVMQWKGRKFTFIIGCIILIIGWITTYTAKSIAMILISEALHGFGSNVLITVSYDCLSEMITPSYRNVAVQSYGIFNILGMALPGIFTKIVHWRVLCIASCIPAIIAIVISFFWLESPLWLAFKDDLEKCKRNFIQLRGNDEFSRKELHQLISAHDVKVGRQYKEQSVIKRYWQEISSRDFYIPALHEILLMNHAYFSGSIVILFYSFELLSKATQNENAAFIGGIIVNLVFVLGSSISGILIKVYKNKPVILSSTVGTTICLINVSVATYLQSVGSLRENSLIVLYLLVGYMICISLGQTTVVFTVTSELMPVKHRGIGGALFVTGVNSFHALSLKISPYLFVSIGIWGTFLVYSLNSTVCGFLIWKYVPETKGRTLQEIECFYTNGTFEIDFSAESEQADTRDESQIS